VSLFRVNRIRRNGVSNNEEKKQERRQRAKERCLRRARDKYAHFLTLASVGDLTPSTQREAAELAQKLDRNLENDVAAAKSGDSWSMDLYPPYRSGGLPDPSAEE
jgi:phage-related minor tail protein